MGPVLVATMAPDDVGDSSSKKLHPFFTKSDHPEASLIPPHEDPRATADEQAAQNSSDGSIRKRRKVDTALSQDDFEPKKRGRKRKSVGQSLNGAILSHLTKSEQDIATTVPAMGELHHKIPALSPGEVSPRIVDDVYQATTSAKSENALHNSAQPTLTASQLKKVLKFNPKTGTLGSPPKPKPIARTSFIVVMKYGKDAEHSKSLGDRITKILEDKQESPQSEKKARKRDTQVKPVTSGKAEKSNATHPFFTGKAKAQPEASKSEISTKRPTKERHTVFMATPVSPSKPKSTFAVGKSVQFSIRSSGTKFPGAMHPLWPTQGMSHVRGEGQWCIQNYKGYIDHQSRKSKTTAIVVAARESVLSHLIDQLDFPKLRNSLLEDGNNITPVPGELRLPHRHFESGRCLQKRIRSQLQTRFINLSPLDERDYSADELAECQSSKSHPAISQLYKALEAQLSAFDRSCCESLSWAQKYAPTSAAQVLQPGKEAMLLRSWLQALRVQSVEGGPTESDRSKVKGDVVPKKKRKKTKLEGFVVDSDDEANEMDEISDDDENWTASPGVGLIKKSVIRSGDLMARASKDQGRLTNVILMSGPHGSGKTATVYAVAKELDFEIFEINAGSRRSGKDILDRVGDMTRNHLVQQNRAESTAIDESDAAGDIKSAKQGMMTSFFKAKRPAQKTNPQAKPQKERLSKEVKASSKSQKQSLILLEEVDVLFEEDKQFWATLMSLIAQSKRPFILTCNDETLVPIQSLSLHGIFRFVPGPTNLAVDLCILIAANEGHALQRSAVEALYCSRNCDLRATISELNFWCQIGVGDRRGGFDWFYLRWPKGSDLDGNGDVVRVISEDTYQKGMGWVSRDPIVTAQPAHAEEEALQQVWDSWKLDLGSWCDTLNMKAWANEQTTSSPSTLAALTAYDAFCSTMSDADICSSGAYGTIFQEAMDPTLPDMRECAKEDFILGLTVLDADRLVRYASPNMPISTFMKSLARTNLRSSTTRNNAATDKSPLRSIDEKRTTMMLDASFRSQSYQMSRMDIAVAFDPIAIAPNAIPTAHLDLSVFDRTTKLIVLDVAPWVRGIVAFEQQLMQRRLKLSNLLSEGGKRKRMRNTRSALSALEGGERRTTRKERHFGDCLNPSYVMRTCGDKWTELVLEQSVRSEVDCATPSSPLSDDLSQ